MSRLGLFMALTDAEREKLLAAGSDDERLDIVQGIEEEWDESRILETDKAWYPIHLALSGRRPVDDPDHDPATYPLDHVIMGGRSLHGKGDPDTDEWIIRLNEPRIVADIVRAFDTMTVAQMRALYDKAAAIEPDVQCGDEDFEYAMAHLDEVKKFFAREAQTGRWIVFMADR